MKILWTSAIASTLFFTVTISDYASAITLYSGSGLPATDRYLAPGAICKSTIPLVGACSSGSNFATGTVNQTSVSGGVQVDTSSQSSNNYTVYSGYSNYIPANSISPTFNNAASYVNPTFNANTLNQTTGYTLNFTVSLDSTESNVSNLTSAPRAVFSVTAINSDNTGIELGFLPTSIFAHSASFGIPAQTTSSTLDTSAATTYTLTVFNNNYSLSTGATQLISGNLQNYVFDNTTSNPPLPFNPYTTPSFIFFGDNTSEASGKFTLGSVNLDTTPIPFEFSPTYGLLAIGTGLAIKNWRKKPKDKIK